MNSMMLGIQRFLRDEEGVTAIEYGLIAAVIAIVLVVGAIAAGTALNALFGTIANCLANPSAATCAF